MPSVPRPELITPLKPINIGTGEPTLEYRLDEAIDSNAQHHHERWDDFLATTPGSVEEATIGKDLAEEFLLRTAKKAIDATSHNRDLWADRFTEASAEIFGRPNREVSIRILRDEYKRIEQLVGNPALSQGHVDYLLKTYKALIDETSDVAVEQSDLKSEAAGIAAGRELGKVLIYRYKPVFDLVRDAELKSYEPYDLVNLFNDGLGWLTQFDDPDWKDWKAEIGEGTNVRVRSKDKIIEIGKDRIDATPNQAIGLLAHELLIHVQRSKNGFKTGDEGLSTGLSGNVNAEEGIAIIAEEGVLDRPRAVTTENYLAIAIASGVINGSQLTRSQMHELVMAQSTLRHQLEGPLSTKDVSDIWRRNWSMVDRIYMGGKGDNNSGRQAILSKDIVYFEGRASMRRYFAEQLQSGKTAEQILDFILLGKFNPLDPLHVAHVENVHNLVGNH